MNCNCCNQTQTRRCGEGDGEIKIYGQLVNSTLDTTLDDANCQANNKSYDTGHNDALAYAYQIHDGRFRADDENLPAHERFQDAINRRVTDITYDPNGGGVSTDPITIIENPYTHDDQGNLVPIGDCDCSWIPEILGASKDNYPNRKNELAAKDINGDGNPDNKNNVIDFILALAAEINNLQARVAALEAGSTNQCLWTVDSDNYICPRAQYNGVKGPGFYDTTVQ